VAEGALDAAENMFDQREVLISQIMHVKADLLNIRTCEGQVV
jgi:hypothetical protein